MRWLALHLPRLSLEAVCATLPAAEAARPVALLSGHRVHSLNAAAAACGIRPGMQRATALALAAELRLLPASPARDAALLQAVAHTALAFTPSVTVHDAQTVLLEVQGSLRLFGGLAALHRRLLAALAPLGCQVQAAAAPTAQGAALLAQWAPALAESGERSPPPVLGASPQPPLSGGGMAPPVAGGAPALVTGPHAGSLAALQALLDAAPLALLAAARPHAEGLQAMGLRTLADLRALPRDGLARRFGPGLLDELDRALGRQPDGRRWFLPPTQFDSRLELSARAEHTDQVLQGARVLLARLLAWARARQSRVGAFTLRLHHERQRQLLRPPTEVPVALAEPSADPEQLQLLLRERLGRLTLAEPTLELQLQCRHLVAGAVPNGELFPTPASEAEGLVRLLERLRARLGDAQVLRLVAVADHRPERATRTEPAIAPASSAGPAPPPAVDALPLHRPVWLWREPLPLAERAGLPLLEGRPLQLLSGPERIETGWWDGAPAARDYYIAQAADHSLVWVWCGRLPGAPGEAQWFLQGRYG